MGKAEWFFLTLHITKSYYDDDNADRLNYLYTTFLILIFGATLAAKSYVGEPLQCWLPKEMPKGWEAYAENFCFVENTYWVPLNGSLGDQNTDMRLDQELQYYQWVPFVLSLQALLFYVPRLFWNIGSWQSGINLTGLMQSAFVSEKSGNTKKLRGHDERDKAIKNAATYLQRTLKFTEVNSKFNRSSNLGKKKVPSTFSGFDMTLLYLLCKVLNVVNVVGQFIILNKFLGTQYTWWGAGILRDLLAGRDWKISGHFPRVTMCDFEIRRLGGLLNVQRYSIQCVLMINMFSEKVYIFLWWWFVFVAVFTILNLLYWIAVSIFTPLKMEMIRKFVCVTRDSRNIDSKSVNRDDLREFVTKTLRTDGCTTIRLIKENAGEIVAAKIVGELWDICHPPPIQATAPPNSTQEVSEKVDE